MMWKEVLRAEYVDAYRIKVWFNDGVQKVVDLSDVIRKYPVFKPLKDMDLFKQFTVTDTLEWKNGQIDIAPEFLYSN